MPVIVLIIYSLLLVYEFVPLYKEQKWADFVVNGTLWTFSLAIAVLLSLNVKIPSPEAPIRRVITMIFGE